LMVFDLPEAFPRARGNMALDDPGQPGTEVARRDGVEFGAIHVPGAAKSSRPRVRRLRREPEEVVRVEVIGRDREPEPLERTAAVLLELRPEVSLEVEPGRVVVTKVVGEDGLLNLVPLSGNGVFKRE